MRGIGLYAGKPLDGLPRLHRAFQAHGSGSRHTRSVVHTNLGKHSGSSTKTTKQAPAKRDIWTDPLIAGLQDEGPGKEPRIYVNSKEVRWDDLAGVLKGELARRRDGRST